MLINQMQAATLSRSKVKKKQNMHTSIYKLN